MASKFGGFLGGPGRQSPSDGSKQTELVPASDAKGLTTQTLRNTTLPRVGGRPSFAIALDATGSMASLIDDARRHIGEILERVRKQLGRPIQVRMLCYRDYDVLHPSNQEPFKLLETSPMTEDAQTLAAWLTRIKAYGGGNNDGEAIESALESIYGTAIPKAERLAAVLLVGDEPSNARQHLDSVDRQQVRTAHDWASLFGERKVPIHSFVVGNRQSAIKDFEKIASLSGGKTGRLDGTDSMLNMAALAMVSAVGGAEAVRQYAARHRLSAPEKAFALLLTGPSQ